VVGAKYFGGNERVKLDGTKEEWAAALAGLLLGAQIVLFMTGHARESNAVFLVLTVLYLYWRRRRKTA
jgi:hypothetical protein